MIKEEFEQRLIQIQREHTGDDVPFTQKFYDLGLYDNQTDCGTATAWIDEHEGFVGFDLKLGLRNAGRLVDFLQNLPAEDEEPAPIRVQVCETIEQRNARELIDLAERALARWKKSEQLGMLQEECAELITAVNHVKRGRVGYAALADEVADVEIMLAQAKLILSDIYPAILASKLDRLEARLTPAVPETIPAPAWEPEALEAAPPPEPTYTLAEIEEMHPTPAPTELERPAPAPFAKTTGLTHLEAMEAMRAGHVVRDKSGDRWRLVPGDVIALEFFGDEGWEPWSKHLSKVFEPYSIEVQP